MKSAANVPFIWSNLNSAKSEVSKNVWMVVTFIVATALKSWLGHPDLSEETGSEWLVVRQSHSL